MEPENQTDWSHFERTNGEKKEGDHLKNYFVLMGLSSPVAPCK
jgi:hypothetical protein